jgi:hypothetical protein
MNTHHMTFSVGHPIGCTPPKEGYMPIVNGSSFDIIAFFSNLKDREQRDWLKGKAGYGVYIENSIPVFLLDLGKSWSLDVYLNILQEKEDIRKAFFEGDPNKTQIMLTLVSYSDTIVRGIRTIVIDPNIMLKIKEACFDQLSNYASKDACQQAADKLMAHYTAKQLRTMAAVVKEGNR